jgi:DNA polymerase III subunit chi
MSEKTIYFVETIASEQRDLLCRWVEKFYEEGARVQVIAGSTQAAQYLDQLLWTFSQPSFVPHGVYSGSGPVPPGPVLITTGEERIGGVDTAVCDTPVSLELMELYRTAVHFVLRDDPERRQESRLMWQRARDRGIAATHVAYRAPPPPARRDG